MIQAVIFGATATIICVGLIYTLWSQEKATNIMRQYGPASTSLGNSRNSNSDGRLRKRILNKPNETECIICFDLPPQVEIYPCNHQILCERCIIRLISESKKMCPLCRRPIKGYLALESNAL